jgi:hypothetical protein
MQLQLTADETTANKGIDKTLRIRITREIKVKTHILNNFEHKFDLKEDNPTYVKHLPMPEVYRNIL